MKTAWVGFVITIGIVGAYWLTGHPVLWWPIAAAAIYLVVTARRRNA